MKKKFIEQTIILKYVLWGDYLTPFTFFLYTKRRMFLFSFLQLLQSIAFVKGAFTGRKQAKFNENEKNIKKSLEVKNKLLTFATA